MDTLFPFGFPRETACYLALYVLTLVLHALFMHYVLAGSACLAAGVAFGRDGTNPKSANPLADTLRDWLPFMLSSAITAGVAPLLFVQVLYETQFYTANLLLFYRWLLILPALVVGFYLLYVQKSKRVATWRLWSRLLVGGGALACFAFAAWSWTENHLLSIHGTAWPEQYASGSVFYASREIPPRLALWFTAAFPTMALVLAWQRWYAQRILPPAERTAGVRRCALFAIGGLLCSEALAAVLYFSVDERVQRTVTSSLAGPYLIAAIVGCAIQSLAWAMQYRLPHFSRNWLLAASAGLALTLIGTAVVRETRRLADVRIEALYDSHAHAFASGGSLTFLFFLVLNTALIGACFVIVRRGIEPNPR